MGTYWSAIDNACMPTDECNSPAAGYCGNVASQIPNTEDLTYTPSQIASYVSQQYSSQAVCIGSAATGAKPAGLNACCPVPGGKNGASVYYDWKDRNGNNAGVTIY